MLRYRLYGSPAPAEQYAATDWQAVTIGGGSAPITRITREA